jgi:hypothetical protein
MLVLLNLVLKETGSEPILKIESGCQDRPDSVPTESRRRHITVIQSAGILAADNVEAVAWLRRPSGAFHSLPFAKY